MTKSDKSVKTLLILVILGIVGLVCVVLVAIFVYGINQKSEPLPTDSVDGINDTRVIAPNKDQQLDECLQSAYNIYTENWNRTCKSNKKANDCELSSIQGERWDDLYKDSKDECYLRYN